MTITLPAMMEPAAIVAIRSDLGLKPGEMAERIGISQSHLTSLETGRAPMTLAIQNAIRWVEHTRGALPEGVCTTCEGMGSVRPPAAPGMVLRGGLAPRQRCAACDGQAVARRGVTA